MKPLVVASECYSGLYPKNSLSGFKYCLSQQIDGIEFDVHLATDNALVIQHDYFLNKRITRNKQGQYVEEKHPPICQLSSRQLAEYDIGRYKPGSPEAMDYRDYQPIDGEPIPTLASFISSYDKQQHVSALWIELKTTPYQREISSDPNALLEQIILVLTEADLLDRSVLLAFEWDLLIKAKALVPEIRTDFLTINDRYIKQAHRNAPDIDPALMYGEYAPGKFNGDIPAAISAAGGDWWGPYVHDVTRADVIAARARDIRVNLWGVDSTEQGIKAALKLGADALTLARPDKVPGLVE